MSPVVLFLIVTLIPTILYAFVPTVGITVYQPQPYAEEDLRDIVFTADAKFISSTSRVFHKVWWEVWEVDQVDPAGNPIDIEYNFDADRSIIYTDQNGAKYPNPTFTFVYGELHDEVDGVIPYTVSETGEYTYEESLYPSQIGFFAGNVVEDTFNYYPFEEGEYQVRVTVENYDPNNGTFLESVGDVIYTTVPADPKQQIWFDSNYMVYGEDETSTSGGSGLSLENVQKTLESGGTYLIALGLLSLPLLFSFGTKILGEDGLGGTSLKNSFYMQCYYFSPVTAIFWASLYATSLYTPDIHFLAILSPFIIFGLILIWFCFAEAHAISIERGVSLGRAWAILFMLLFALAGGSAVVFLILNDLDFLRRYSIALYPLAAAIVFVAYFVRRRRERLLAKQKAAQAQSEI
jgi:hypothetical protein